MFDAQMTKNWVQTQYLHLNERSAQLEVAIIYLFIHSL